MANNMGSFGAKREKTKKFIYREKAEENGLFSLFWQLPIFLSSQVL